jgi:hypothetical protein
MASLRVNLILACQKGPNQTSRDRDYSSFKYKHYHRPPTPSQKRKRLLLLYAKNNQWKIRGDELPTESPIESREPLIKIRQVTQMDLVFGLCVDQEPRHAS